MDNVKNTKNDKTKTVRSSAVFVARVALMAGMLTAFKFALSFIPNVEVVTVLIIVFASAWGLRYALPATLVFCAVEVAIYGGAGYPSWIILYFIYWPLLAVVSWACLRKKQRTWVAMIIGVVGSVIFGVMSACTDTLCVIGLIPNENLATYWALYYVRGLWFDLVHVASSFVTILALYGGLVKISKRIQVPKNSVLIGNDGETL